jgi:hypothetical protein
MTPQVFFATRSLVGRSPRARGAALGWVVPLLATVLATGCEDPVRQRAIDELGPESPGVRPGPLHRPGQPCLLCHDSQSGDKLPFVMAGTIYADDTNLTPVNDVSVRMTDAMGTVFTASTNCAGNFFVHLSEFAPRFPMWVTVAAEGQTIDMESPVYREGSCTACHTDPKRQSSAGHVFLLADTDSPPLAPGHYCR